jgi:hypothetical protein
MIAGAALMMGAAGQAALNHQWNPAGIFLCYAIANALLAFVK